MSDIREYVEMSVDKLREFIYVSPEDGKNIICIKGKMVDVWSQLEDLSDSEKAELQRKMSDAGNLFVRDLIGNLQSSKDKKDEG